MLSPGRHFFLFNKGKQPTFEVVVVVGEFEGGRMFVEDRRGYFEVAQEEARAFFLEAGPADRDKVADGEGALLGDFFGR